MKKKKLLIFLLSFIVLLNITACTNKNIESSSKEEPKKELKDKVTVWSFDDNYKVLNLAKERFKNEYPNVNIELINIDKNKIYDKTIESLKSGKDIPDIVTVEGYNINNLISNFPSGFIDLKEYVNPIKGKFLPYKMKEVTVKDKVMAVPFDASPSAMFYRKDIFKSAGVVAEDIKTWDDYIEAGKKISLKYGGKVKMLPLDLKGDNSFYRQLINQQEGKPILNSEESIKALELIKKMVDSNIVFEASGFQNIVDLAKKGEIASMPYTAKWNNIINTTLKNEKNNWDILRFPSFEPGGKNAACLEGSDLMLASTSKNKEASVTFLLFAVTDKTTSIAALRDYGVYPSYNNCGDEITNCKFTQIARDILNISYPKDFKKANDKIIAAQQGIIYKKEQIKDLLDKLEKQ